jgi:hypothetical protein
MCLAAFSFGQPRIAPMVFALAAAVEGSHAVLLETGLENQLTVVLSHERGRSALPDYTPAHDPRSGLHRHGMASSIFCVLSATASGEADHVACFLPGSLAEEDDDDLRCRWVAGSDRFFCGTGASLIDFCVGHSGLRAGAGSACGAHGLPVAPSSAPPGRGGIGLQI